MPLVLRSVDLQIEAAPGKKPNGQILKPRAQACESYAYLPRGSIRELMGPFWPEDASLSATRRGTRSSKKCEDRSSCVRMPAAKKAVAKDPVGCLWGRTGDPVGMRQVSSARPMPHEPDEPSRPSRPTDLVDRPLGRGRQV